MPELPPPAAEVQPPRIKIPEAPSAPPPSTTPSRTRQPTRYGVPAIAALAVLAGIAALIAFSNRGENGSDPPHRSETENSLGEPANTGEAETTDQTPDSKSPTEIPPAKIELTEHLIDDFRWHPEDAIAQDRHYKDSLLRKSPFGGRQDINGGTDNPISDGLFTVSAASSSLTIDLTAITKAEGYAWGGVWYELPTIPNISVIEVECSVETDSGWVAIDLKRNSVPFFPRDQKPQLIVGSHQKGTFTYEVPRDYQTANFIAIVLDNAAPGDSITLHRIVVHTADR